MASKNIDEDIIDCSKIFHEDKEHFNEKLEKQLNEYLLPIEEYSDICFKCQQRHFNTKGFKEDGSFPVTCKGIPKRLSEEHYYPLELVYGEDYDKLTMSEKVQLQYKNNKLLWAEHMLGWSPYNPKRKFNQYYQEEMLLCTAIKQVGRLGRRMGKSEIIVIKALHYGMTTFIKNPHVLIIAPFMNLCDELHQRFIDKLNDSVYAGQFSSTKKPYVITIPRTQFGDVCTIKLFTTGSGSGNAGASTRGQSADMLFIDEAGYTDQESLEAVLPLVFEHDEVELTVTSTPSQMPNKFKEWCMEDKSWKDYHFPFTIMPNFKPGNEKYEEFKKMYGIQGWKQEIEADFFEGNAKVFKTEDIKASLQEYKYPANITEIPDAEDWRFIIGVDWNAAKHGVQIVLQGVNLISMKTKVWKRVSVSNLQRGLQLKAVEEIMKMDRDFGAEKIIVDQGYGAVQVEILLKHYQRISREDKIVAVDFASTLIQEHPLTKEKFSKRIKSVMVANLQQRFEFGTIIISKLEEGDLPTSGDGEGKLLVTQLDNYEIEKYDNRDNPIFKASGPGTDHALDGLLLSNYGINKYIEKVFDLRIGHRPSMGSNVDKSDIFSEIESYLNIANDKIKSRYTNSSMRENFTNVYNQSVLNKDQELRIQQNQSGKLNKLFGTSSKRLARRNFR